MTTRLHIVAARSSTHLSPGFASSLSFTPGEDPEKFQALLVALKDEHRPDTISEQMLVEQMAVSHWISLRATRLLSLATGGGDLNLLIRYKATADRTFHGARNEIIRSRNQKPNPEIGFEPQNAF